MKLIKRIISKLNNLSIVQIKNSKMVSIKDEYFSASTNRSLNVIDISDDVLSFGSSNAILIYDYKNHSILAKLDKHEDKVNCVKFFDSGNRILSCSGDKKSIIWKRSNQTDYQYEIEFILSGHNSSIDIGCSIVLNDGSILTLTFSNDSFLNVWNNDQLISTKQEKHFIFDIKLISNSVNLFQDKVIALFASSDTFVHLFAINENFELIKLINLVGHQEWVRSVDFMFENNDTLMVASGAQDNFIRIWSIQVKEADNLDTDTFFDLDNKKYSVILDTVISGHEDKVYCVKWLNRLNCSDFKERLKLVSVSLDKTVIIWEQPEKGTNNLWFEKHRLGEISGNNLGLLSCAISKSNKHIIVNSFNGALHYWYLNEDNWVRKPVILGHFQPVTDLHWDPNNNYILSASLDATCRIHGIWKRDDKSKDTQLKENQKNIWFELARPQVHGYELNCIAPISSTKFVSGADEKVLRVYQATNSFVNSFEKITKVKHLTDEKLPADFATVPSLGLSNYAVNESNFVDKKKDVVFKPEIFDEPPKEESLLTNTLWPEIQKIYGHGYEIFSLAVNGRRDHIASACKATNSEDAAVCIWNIKTDYSLLQRLIFHKLTVTSIKFSPNGDYLVTVSRDRNWALYKFNQEHNEYKLVANSNKDQLMHSRIIWNVCWSPDNQYFMTSSRDKQVIVWKLDAKTDQVTPFINEHILKLKESAYGLDISSKLIKNDQFNKYTVAFGIENGDLLLNTWSPETGWIELLEIKRFHTISIRKVKFNSNGDLLATCGDDCFVRIIRVIL